MPSISASKTVLDALRQFLAAGQDNAPFAVAFSGGRDSSVLLWALVQVAGRGAVVALHVDHGWRSAKERRTERTLVELACRAQGVPLVAFAPPDAVVRTEAAARAHRYACFSSYLADNPSASVFLAHHADDQAETVLMRLLKGRSWMGLEGMPARRGPYRRPFLNLRAGSLAEAAREQSLTWHEDSTNADTSPQRNLLRLSVLPVLRERFPRVVESLNEFAAAWREVAPSRAVDPAWQSTEQGWQIVFSEWDSWGPLARQAQLIALMALRGETVAVSRRFLELVCRDGKRGRTSGTGWRWVRRASTVEWGPLTAPKLDECWIQAEPERWYQLNGYRWCWTGPQAQALAIASIDPDLPWVWRTASPGGRLGSAETPEWGKTTRRHRLGASVRRQTAVLVQQGLVRAVVDPLEGRLLWVETPDRKLHKGGIFVTLIAATRNLTE